MRFDLLSAVPGIFESWQSSSVLARGQAAGAIDIRAHDVRDWAHDKHRIVDDYPYGGGAGMVLKPEPMFEAIDALRALAEDGAPVILMSPQGEPFGQAIAQELAAEQRLILVCGRYEGVDERVRQFAVDRCLSVGDFVVTGGELPAMMVVDAVARLVPGVLGDAGSADDESFSDGLLEYPQYTRPACYRGHGVPAELLGGHHERVRLWRRMESLRRTFEQRPDLLSGRPMSDEERRLLARLLAQKEGEDDV